MISNERQYKLTKAKVKEFHETMDRLRLALPKDLDPRLYRAHQQAVASQLEEMELDIREYERRTK